MLDNDAVKIGELYTKARTSIVDSARFMLEAGAKLAAKKESLPHGEWLPWLKENKETLGFEDITAVPQRLMKVARKFDASVEYDEPTALAINREAHGHLAIRGTTGTGENEWFTPPEHIKLARAVLGAIDLDPATRRPSN